MFLNYKNVANETRRQMRKVSKFIKHRVLRGNEENRIFSTLW